MSKQNAVQCKGDSSPETDKQVAQSFLKDGPEEGKLNSSP
jgi:hypothetical protein